MVVCPITVIIMQSPPPQQASTAVCLLRILPAVVPAAIVAATGDWRLLTLDINLNRMPSRAMAKRMRGRGNMQPNRLERRSFMVKFRKQREKQNKTRTHDTSTKCERTSQKVSVMGSFTDGRWINWSNGPSPALTCN